MTTSTEATHGADHRGSSAERGLTSTHAQCTGAACEARGPVTWWVPARTSSERVRELEATGARVVASVWIRDETEASR